MMNHNEINEIEVLETVKLVIHQSSGVALETIHAESTLFHELNIDSIDMVDILFNLERKYNIELKISEIENYAKQELGDEPFEIDNVITSRGLQILKEQMPELDQGRLEEGITIHDIIKLITVQSLTNLVVRQIVKKNS